MLKNFVDAIQGKRSLWEIGVKENLIFQETLEKQILKM
jgi:hypothetical protein